MSTFYCKYFEISELFYTKIQILKDVFYATHVVLIVMRSMSVFRACCGASKLLLSVQRKFASCTGLSNNKKVSIGNNMLHPCFYMRFYTYGAKPWLEN